MNICSKTLCLALLVFNSWLTIAEDTHVDRASNRTQFSMDKSVVEVEQKLLKIIPAELVGVHHWLILHGRCTRIARKPRCGSCIIEDLYLKDKTEIKDLYRKYGYKSKTLLIKR